MTHREQNLWGLLVGLALTVIFGAYKASHDLISAPAESSSAAGPDSIPNQLVEPPGTDGEGSSDSIDAAADKAMNDAANAAAADQAANSLSGQSQAQDGPPPQNLLPEDSSDGAIANVNPSTTTPAERQPEGGEE